jgi:hypothetical protein
MCVHETMPPKPMANLVLALLVVALMVLSAFQCGVEAHGHGFQTALTQEVTGTHVTPVDTAKDACNASNTTFLSLANICIHSDHSGNCGTKGQDVWNVVMGSGDECRSLCCEHRDICAAYLWYASSNGTCCTGEGCHGNVTTPPSDRGAPCCWMKSAVAPAHLWSNNPYCTEAGVVYVPGPL